MTNFSRLASLFALILAVVVTFFAAMPAFAVEPIKIARDDKALDLSGAVQIYRNQGENFQVSTAPGPDGIVRRIEVEANDARSSGDWAVFALANTTDQQLDRLIVAPHFRLVNSGIFWPDLGSTRIAAITPSEGFALDRQTSPDADVFRVTLNPGTVVTFIAELASPKLPQVYLWEPDSYKDSVNSYTLFRGIVIGISGLLALFLTILFVVKGTSMFPATAALAWAVLAYICVDFGFLNKIIEISPGNEQIWRAGTEVALAGTFVVFLFAYLNLNRWHGHFSYGALVWILGLLLIAGVAIVDPAVAAGIARISFAATALTGLGLIIFLGIRGYDRAIMLVPSWVMVLLWLCGSWMAITGMLDNDIAQPALGGGLILIILLIGFTVMQHAFAGGALHQGLFSDLERQALAVAGSGDIVWDWDVLRDRVVTKPDISLQLGLAPNSLGGAARNWLPVLHADDRDTFRTTLDVVLEHRRGKVAQNFRLRGADGHYHWFSLRARPVIGSDGEVIRCVGTIVDVTEQKKSEERLLHDAVHDNLTGLPNRELFMNRLEAIISIARTEDKVRPTVFIIDIDRFKQVNDGLGISAGDTILLTVARRLHRLLKPKDSLSRFAGDQFALMLLSEQDPARIAAMADAIKHAINNPITFAKREIVLTASIGLITWTTAQTSAEDMVKDAELAMHQAKRFGGDRIEPFRPAFRTVGTDRLQFESDLRRAIERREFTLAYQPIVRLEDGSVAGFEALLRWDHPRRGMIPPGDFIPVAENCGLIVQLGLFAMQQAAEDLAGWQKQIGDAPLSVSVNLSSRQLIRRDLVSDVRSVIARANLKPRCFRLELTESLVMDNPEQTAHVLTKLKQLGIGLSLDDFGTGYSSLSYLTRFPFDTIKIDKSFVDDATPKRAVLLKSMVNMAHELGLSVVAEGISDESDALELRQMGCEYVQSFMFGAPMPGDQVLKTLKEQYPLTQA
ncbi:MULTISPECIES: EAL domain-containing protein [unclassified Mesorhizobium]|uniref:EAL domain-containing protein n=5 Tax=Mesorhizobium TaxID=68287 RepID=UPI000F7524F1|nr:MULTISPECIES: EAL domain-containing protein [unclassified Mesorhizobium]AZO05979.1 EAL domain-containing protein [Mesorhizobium sp. M2A.F.Ca.ET.043.02.1.1]RUW38192.1 EAL domain-containing protein [Mesorhizobium sp. M2A.F.Ca.ET.015.02.1.1]RVC94988.1 EAL domain-containing protein [Mesorhizobium sp. M2A.F.Ca.ET.017.03.2.1]RWB44157.1 MAG: EAL domain-containing protein [Mesorhizobium sp.]RWB60939.1 MAG: EAL domain-containing protein [Mesorhizobium sp.]